MKSLLDWLDQRTGCRKITREALFENIPGGSRWRYVWGSTLTFALAVQFITGIFLWMAYSPSSQTAWESVYYIQNEMSFGWLLRGLHHFTAQMMTVLLLLHLMQVVIDGAYKAPREVNFWFGLILLQLVLGLSLTGYLLPWDQKGFWATRVATSLLSSVPGVGAGLQRVIIGGPDYGHHTLTRFFALHAGVLPGLIIALLAGHIYLFRRHGITPKEPKRQPDAAFWPDQVFKDAVACLAVLATVLFLILRARLFSPDAPLGAELGAPADPSEPYSAARPEWYFLFLFQFLKFFPGETEIWGAFIIPGLLMGLVFLMPFIGRWRLGHGFNLGLLGAVLAAAGLLTFWALTEDRSNVTYQVAARNADHEAERVKILAKSPAGIPGSGAVTLLRNDPLIQGPKLFKKHCSSCHRYSGHDALGEIPTTVYVVKTNDSLASIAEFHRMTERAVVALNNLLTNQVVPGERLKVNSPPAASDLKGFATREWLSGLLDPERIDTSHYFGVTRFKEGKMVKFVKKEIPAYTPVQAYNLKKVIAAVSAEAQLKSQIETDQNDAALIAEGRNLLRGEFRCAECHQFRKKDEDATAPDLTGYGSRRWIVGIIGNPSHPSYYGKRNDRMPAFGDEKIMEPQAIGLLADWLRGQWYEPTH